MADDFFDLKYSILLEEWKACGSNIGRLDGIVFTIRGWAITTTTAAIAYAYTKADPEVCMLVLIPLLLLWIIDAMFKTFQRVFIVRSKEIEQYLVSDQFKVDFDGRSPSFVTPVLSSRFGQGSIGGRLGELFAQAFLRNVVATYVSLIIFSLCSYVVIATRIG
ncbi:hypothetical protein [Yoonia sp. 208BN28-4]|uniref:hypothetical protein n=1 Tax=Yoonia sp. 208BN28-4 TaxID=3126505 RepID=UPI0030AD8DB2